MKIIITILAFIFGIFTAKASEVAIWTSQNLSPRIIYGIEKLTNSFNKSGYKVVKSTKTLRVYIGVWSDSMLLLESKKAGIIFDSIPGKEGYSIKSGNGVVIVRGADASGALYGCLELALQTEKQNKIPEIINITETPKMVMRGACVGLQKTVYLPGRDVYEYPYTPQNFPWFYDKSLWIKFLDMLVENRMNSLYLWNGHPFASLVRLKDYPYAVEVDDETFKKNEEIFSFLTTEADKRGIWIIQMFYNIIISKPFAEKHGLKTQDRNRPITPIISDYMRKSVAAFIEKYPNTGLLITLGEAINTEEDDIKWFTGTIIPGVKDGLKALGTTDEPPIILRAHDTNAPLVLKEALPLYMNIYTMHKYNGESLTTYEPRGPWTDIHKKLSSVSPVHIDNVHILANLEPFRYGSPDFIQKSIKAMHNVHGANGLHLYPQASYWDWPFTADNLSPRLLQLDRDWIWYKAWSRYAWKSSRDRNDEVKFWTNELGNFYGCGNAGSEILEAYEQSGEIAPKLLRRFGITDGNRETLTLGLFMSQLVNPAKWKFYPSFYASNGPEGEILIEFAEKEWKKMPHTGETPPQIIEEVLQHANKAVESIEKADASVTKNREEFLRLKNDIYCYSALANFFYQKVTAAMHVLRYNYSKDITDLEKALPFLEKSTEHFIKLVNLTKTTYLYANSMQTKQRRIPIGGNDGKNKTWDELLPHYNEELIAFKKNIQLLKNTKDTKSNRIINKPLINVPVKIQGENIIFVKLEKDLKIFTDKDLKIKSYAEELEGLLLLRFSSGKQKNDSTTIHFTNDKPVNVIVGYFNSTHEDFLQAPALETNAHANDQGQAEAKLVNAVDIQDMPPVNLHFYHFEAGNNSLQLGKGIGLIMGFTDASQNITPRNVGLGITQKDGVDWLFY